MRGMVAIDGRLRNLVPGPTQGGWFPSDQEHIIERFTRPSKNYLIYQVAIEDPKVLTKSWTSVPRKWSLNHGKLDEYYCTNNQEVQQYQFLKQEEDAKKPK